MVLHISGHIPWVQANKLLERKGYGVHICSVITSGDIGKAYSAFETFSGLINIHLNETNTFQELQRKYSMSIHEDDTN